MAEKIVRTKFRCVEMGKIPGWGGSGAKFHYSYRFTAVSDGSEENKKFFAATPSAEVRITALRDDLFEVGEEYYADFTSANQPSN